jgi:GntR family transcriptional regulator, transcriptional repressor for pyruvate dehydrogenase complex
MARVSPTAFTFAPVQMVRPAEVVAFRITEAILAGDVRVGERLPSEQALSLQLGISRPTLREAIKLLVHAGLVKVLPGSSGGLFVISESVPAELAGYPVPDLPGEQIAAVIEARRWFEPQVARVAAQRGTAADFERMRVAVELSFTVSASNRSRAVSHETALMMTIASTRFNIAVARATQNSVVVKMMEVLLRRMDAVRMAAIRGLDDITESARSLRESQLAIESGDTSRIEAATAARIDLLELAWRRVSSAPRAKATASRRTPRAKAGQALPSSRR